MRLDGYVAAAAVLSTCTILIVGCRQPASYPAPTAPTPPADVNARLPHDQPGGSLPGKADTVLVGRCVSSDEYAATRSGDWIDHWHLVRFDILSVEKGQWQTSSGRATGQPLLFVARDTWPTPESGIMVDKAPWPYRPGLIYAFAIDTTQTPPMILSQDARSVIELSRAPTHVNLSAPDGAAVSAKIDAAVTDYFENDGRTMKGRAMSHLEEVSDAYIVMLWTGWTGSEFDLLRVDKKTFGVERVPLRPGK